MPRADPNDVNPTRCIAVGEGVDQAVTGKLAKFAIQGCLGLANLVDVEFEGPAVPPYTKEPDETGNIHVTYTPPVPGEYKIIIRVKDKQIKNSPYQCEVIGEGDPKLKKVQLVEVQGKGVIVAKATKENVFFVDARRANLNAGLAINVKCPERCSAQLNIEDNNDGTFKVKWKPTNPGLYVVNVKVEGVHVPSSPFYVRATN